MTDLRQLSLFAPRMPSAPYRAQPHPRLDHPEITADYVAWISHGGQVCVETRCAGESAEAWADRAWALVRRWDVASAYSAGVCTWDSRDRKDVTND